MELILLPVRITLWMFEFWFTAIYCLLQLYVDGLLFAFEKLAVAPRMLFEAGRRHAAIRRRRA